MFNKNELGRGAAYIYIQVIVSTISAYVFWLIITHLTSSVVIGTISAVISITEILTSFAVMGIPTAIQRFLGRTISEQKIQNSKMYIASSFFFISIGITASSIFIFVGGTFFGPIPVDISLQLVLIFIIASKSIQLLLSSVLVSTLKTGVLAQVNIISSTVKIGLSITVILTGGGVIGLAISYLLVDSILSSVLLALVIRKRLKSESKDNSKTTISFSHASKEIITGGVTNWIPILVTSIGYQLGTIILFGSKGSSDAATYFLTLNIANGILFSAAAIFTIALPALSSMQDNRKRLTWQTIRWSSLVAIPLSASLIFFSQDIMSWFGQSYIKGALSLQILLLSILPTIVADGISNLVFSYGNYRKSLSIHLSMNLPRTLLYFILIPAYGIIGGATSFVIGALLAFVVSVIISSKIGIFIYWKDLALILMIPIGISYFLYSLHLYYLYSIPITVVASYLLLYKLGTLTSVDFQDTLNILPSSVSKRISLIWKKLRD